MNQYTKCLFGGALVTAGMAATTQGAISQVFSRGALAANNMIDWGQLGSYGTIFPSGSGGTTSPSNVGFTVSQPGGGNLYRIDQSVNWNGCFTPGDRAIWNYFGSDTIRVDFASPTDRVGANVQADYYGGFQGYISVFDTSNNFIGSFNSYGYASGNADGSAVFLGVQSDAFDIGAVEFRVFSYTGYHDMAINQLDEHFVPTPGAAGLLGLAGIAATRRRRTDASSRMDAHAPVATTRIARHWRR